jgi:hypothetical protein
MGVHYKQGGRRGREGKGGFFILQVFQQLLVLKISDEGASSGDPKGKYEYLSRGEKRRRELEARRQSAQCYAGASRSTNDGNKPSEEYKAAVFKALY